MDQLLNLGFLDYALLFGLISIGGFYFYRKSQNKNEFDEATIRGFNMVPVQERQQDTSFINKMKAHVSICEFNCFESKLSMAISMILVILNQDS